MNTIKRDTLDKISVDMFKVLHHEYWIDDDKDLFLDTIMQWTLKEFGVGEILEYLSIYFVATGSDEDGINVELNRISEKLQEIADSIPELKS